MYDQVVFACHPDEALAILGNNATDEERKVLGSFEYSSNDVYVHSDINLMPKARAAWTSWNYLGTSNKNDDNAVFVTYWINKLQSIEHDKEILVSLNPTTLPASEKTYCKIVYTHPQYSVSAVEGQRMMPSLQGNNNTYFAGAYLGYGFHEDGIRSGLEVAITMGSNANHAKWIQQNGIGNMIPASNFQKTMMKIASSFSIGSYFNRFMEILSQQFFFFFLTRGIHTGVLHFILPDGTKRSFRGKKRHETDEVTIIIYSYRFFSRVVFEYELGLCLSYVAGEWTVAETSSNYDGITKLLLLLLDNTYQSNKKNYTKSTSLLYEVPVNNSIKVWKQLHVSPFNPSRNQYYLFNTNINKGDTFNPATLYWDISLFDTDDSLVLSANMKLMAVRTPKYIFFNFLIIIFRIYYQALLLWMGKFPVYNHIARDSKLEK